MEQKGLLPCSQEPAISSYPEWGASSLHLHTLFPPRSILILSSDLRLWVFMYQKFFVCA